MGIMHAVPPRGMSLTYGRPCMCLTPPIAPTHARGSAAQMLFAPLALGYALRGKQGVWGGMSEAELKMGAGPQAQTRMTAHNPLVHRGMQAREPLGASASAACLRPPNANALADAASGTGHAGARHGGLDGRNHA